MGRGGFEFCFGLGLDLFFDFGGFFGELRFCWLGWF